MSWISAYLMSIVGVVIIGVVIDLILHDGSTAKYIKSLFAVFVMFVILAPLPKLLNGELSLAALFDGSQYALDETFLNTIKSDKAESLKQQTQKYLETNGFKNVGIDFSLDPDTTDLVILSVYVDLQNLVITSKEPNINKYTAIKSLIKTYLLVEEGKVIFYG